MTKNDKQTLAICPICNSKIDSKNQDWGFECYKCKDFVCEDCSEITWEDQTNDKINLIDTICSSCSI